MNNYHIYEKIGHGKHSTVYKGRKKKTISYYAIKSVDKTQKARVLQEVSQPAMRDGERMPGAPLAEVAGCRGVPPRPSRSGPFAPHGAHGHEDACAHFHAPALAARCGPCTRWTTGTF